MVWGVILSIVPCTDQAVGSGPALLGHYRVLNFLSFSSWYSGRPFVLAVACTSMQVSHHGYGSFAIDRGAHSD
jgi:hypothetical protein